jgi:nitrogen-specific signal transduction histidine kinase/CheY-like chemotaxis protein
MDQVRPDAAIPSCIEKTYGSILQCLGDIVYKVSPDGLFDFVNDSVVKLGYEPAELLGKHFSTIIHPDIVASVSRAMVLPLYKGRVTGDGHAPGLFDERRTGPRMTQRLPVKLIPKGWSPQRGENTCLSGCAVMHGELTASGHYGGTGEYAGAVGLICVSTGQLKIMDDLKRAARFESAGIMAAGIAHDFNNFLTGIFGNLQLARGIAGTPPELLDRLEDMSKSFELAKSLTNQLQTITRGAKPTRTMVNCSDLLKESCTLSLCGGAVQSAVTIESNRHVIEADRNQIIQLFCNLLINARQAMRDDGTVTITLCQCSIEADNSYQLPAGAYEKVEIRDQGSGIPAMLLPKVFTPFFTTKPGGSGLGLSTGLAIARDHGGTILATSTEGQGTTFTVYLPSATGAVVQPQVQGAFVGHKGRGRILILDDEPIIRGVVCVMLSQAGYDPVGVACGEHAVARCRQAVIDGNRFEVALLDLSVPEGLGGEKTVQLLLKQDPLLVAIAISGYTYPSILSQKGGGLFLDFIAKPFHIDELLHKVSNAVETRKKRKAALCLTGREE